MPTLELLLLTFVAASAAAVATIEQPLIQRFQGGGLAGFDRCDSADILIAALVPSADDGALDALESALELVSRERKLPQSIRLRVSYVVTECNAANATKYLFDLLHHLPSAFVLFGAGCPGLTGPVAQMSFFWNISLVSYSDTSPELADETRYRNLLRVAPSDADFNLPRLRLMRMFNWTKTCSIYEDASATKVDSSSSQAAASAHMDDQLEAAGADMTDVSSRSFNSFESALVQLTLLKASDFRVLSAMTSRQLLAPLFCAAYNTDMFGSRHVWIVSGFRISAGLWAESNGGGNFSCFDGRCNCSRRELLTAANSSLYIDLVRYSGSSRLLSQLTPEAAIDNPFSAYAFDSVLAVAEAASTLLAADRGAPPAAPGPFLRNLNFKSAMEKTNISGVTGPVHFNKGSRLGLLALYQLTVDAAGLADISPRLRLLSIFDCGTREFDNGTELGERISWPGGSPPRDRTEIERRLVTLQLWLFLLFACLACLGLALSLALMAVNIRYRGHRYIKMSSPQMNNLIVVGCALCYLSVIFLGMDSGILASRPGLFVQICSTRAWVLSIGFTLSFGAMFSKTWRVHCIFTNISMSKKIIKDYQLMLIVVFLLLIDIAILLAWMISDPMWRERGLLTVQKLSNDRELHFYREVCESHRLTLWLGLLFAYKGLLLVVGCFFAWETRHVSIPALNDSKYIGMSVYNVLVMCLAGAAVSFALKDNNSASFVILSTLIFFSTTITLGLVFFPKLIELRRDPHGEEKRVRATLRKVPKRPMDLEEDQCSIARLNKLIEENEQLRLKLDTKMGEIRSMEDELRVYRQQDSSKASSSSSDRGFSEDRPARGVRFMTDESASREPQPPVTAAAVISFHQEFSGKDTRQAATTDATSGRFAETEEQQVWVRRRSGDSGRLTKRLSRGVGSSVTEEEAFDREIADLQERLLTELPSECAVARTPSYPGLKEFPRLHFSLRETAILDAGDTRTSAGHGNPLAAAHYDN